MSGPTKSIGRDAAIDLYDSNWWDGKTPREIAGFQLFTAELCCPFDVFHAAVEKALNRPVWTHEFALNYDGLVKEFLGEADPPSMEDIINMIPAEKRILIVTT